MIKFITYNWKSVQCFHRVCYNIVTHCIKTSSPYVCMSLASPHNDTPGCVLKRDASVLLHNANKSYSEASKSKICGQI